MSKTRSRTWKLIRIALLLVVAAGLVVVFGPDSYRRHRRSLFDGPYVDREDQSDEDARRDHFYKQVAYNKKSLKPYRVPDRPRPTVSKKPTLEPEPVSDDDFLDKPDDETGWERGKKDKAFHRDWGLDARTAASRIARLRSVTAYRERWTPRFLTVTYPPDNALFPPNLTSPFLEWADVHNDLWMVTLAVPERRLAWEFVTDRRRWRIPDDVWDAIRQNAAGGKRVTLRVKGILRGRFLSKGRESVHRSRIVAFTVAEHPADNAVIYRRVAPPFYSKKTPNMFVRDVREKTDRVFLGSRRRYCFNCHTFSSKSGTRGKLALQVRYSGRRDLDHHTFFSVYDIDRREGRRTILPFKIQMTTWMSWSPDETLLAFSGNQQITAYLPITLETQSIGQPSSDIGVYDLAAQRAALLPGASDDNTLELYPYWTPEGDALVYSSAPAGRHPIHTQYELMVIRYNHGKGGQPVALLPPPNEGEKPRSSYFARFSPDGRWLSWVSSDYGSLIKASSDIYLFDWKNRTKPGTRPKKLASNAPFAADSWHSWSSNSRWLVFASKRDDGVFARLYLTHINDNGDASPAVRLPLNDPTVRISFNIPEFVRDVPPVDDRDLFRGVNADAKVLNVKPGRAAQPK